MGSAGGTDPRTFTTSIEVRFADLDAYGHVNNAIFFTYLETARTKLFLERFLSLTQRGLLLLVVHASCDYLKPIELADPVVVTMEIGRIGRSSFDMAYLIHDGQANDYAKAKTTMVCYDARQRNTVALPEDFLALLG